MCINSQDAMTLEEIKEQVASSENRLRELQIEKHELVLQLKKVRVNLNSTRLNESTVSLISQLILPPSGSSRR